MMENDDNNNVQLRRRIDVDVVFCIDTASDSFLLDKAKNWLESSFEDFKNARKSKGKSEIERFRIRVVLFGEEICDIRVTDFFVLPKQKADFDKMVKSIRATRNSNNQTYGLEALAYAIRSKWNFDGELFKRHIIFLWTDSNARELEGGRGLGFYPKGMVKSINELFDWWDELCERSEFLILFAPNDNEWKRVSENLCGVLHIGITDIPNGEYRCIDGSKEEVYKVIT